MRSGITVLSLPEVAAPKGFNLTEIVVACHASPGYETVEIVGQMRHKK
jgi:hypothetical protein